MIDLMRTAGEITAEPGYRARRDRIDAIVASAGSRRIVTYRRHNCQRKHRTYAAFAKCVFPKARIGIFGEGPYATLSCPKYEPKLYMYGDYSAHLHETEEGARKAAGWIDDTGCGGGCNRGNWEGHRIIRLELGAGE
jgi:hypothetical protein